MSKRDRAALEEEVVRTELDDFSCYMTRSELEKGPEATCLASRAVCPSWEVLRGSQRGLVSPRHHNVVPWSCTMRKGALSWA